MHEFMDCVWCSCIWFFPKDPACFYTCHRLLPHVFEVSGQISHSGDLLNVQVDSPERGFSFLREGPLDMRMGPSVGITAADIVNTWPQEELGHLIRLYGEDKFWKR